MANGAFGMGRLLTLGMLTLMLGWIMFAMSLGDDESDEGGAGAAQLPQAPASSRLLVPRRSPGPVSKAVQRECV